MASFDDLRRLDRRPVETGRFRVPGPVFAGIVSPPFVAPQLQVELASQPESQGTTSAAQFPTTALSVPQARASLAGNSRQGVGRV